jgi:hypothetical protein
LAEIVKPPKDGKWCIIYECKHKWCNATIKAFKEDIRVSFFNGSYCEEGERLPCTSCPCCGTLHKMSWNDIPPDVEQTIKKERER